MGGHQRHLLRIVFVALPCLLCATFYWTKQSPDNILIDPEQVSLPKASASSTNMTVEEEMLHRKERLKQMCTAVNESSLNITPSWERYLIYQPKDLLFCYVAKVGCTYWKRVFLTMQYSKNNNTKWSTYLRKTHKSLVHRLKIDSLKGWSSEEANKYLSSAEKIVFVRDPYSRLYSAYVDKFVMGDFWGSYGKVIINEVRQKPSIFSQECGHDVTFEEFLKYVLLHSGTASAKGGEEHWFPVSKLCHPCYVNFDYIGKQESFSRDRDFISSQIHIHDLISSLEETSLEDSAISSMAQSAVLLWARTGHASKGCKAYSLKRDNLLRGFSYQGYLPENSELNWTAEKETLQEFIIMVRTLFRKQSLQADEFHKRREFSKISAYKNVPLSLLYKIKETFKTDFLLFEYDSLPDAIFTHR